MEARDTLLYFALKYQGEWSKIYKAICQKEPFDEESLNELKNNLKSEYISILDEKYPNIFKNIQCPPFVLFYRGNIDLIKKKEIATVVGTRKVSKYGEMCTKRIVDGLADYHYYICSGLAKGVDGIAHRQAIIDNIPNIAVVANGIDQKYPSSNGMLYEEIIDNGGVILSEYPDGVPPTTDKFNMRNRILATLGEFTVVTEAFQRSGTLLTVKHALYLGRDVYCFPTAIDDSHINNQLIKDGAILIESADDLIVQNNKF